MKPIFKILIVFIVFYIILIFPGCGNKDNNPESKEIYFNIDSLRLGEKSDFTALDFSIHPPKNYRKLDSVNLLNVTSAINQTVNSDDQYKIIPQAMYVSDSTKSFLLVSLINFKDKDTNLSQLADRYFTSIEKKQDKNTLIKRGEYTKGGEKIYQLLLSSDFSVVFKILFENKQKEIVSLDYSVPKQIYQNEMKSIESSIGTLTINKSSKQ